MNIGGECSLCGIEGLCDQIVLSSGLIRIRILF